MKLNPLMVSYKSGIGAWL